MTKRKHYQIRIHSREEFEQAMTRFFEAGYVFNSVRRFKTFKEIDARWYIGVWWYWVIVGYDKECNRVITTFNSKVTEVLENGETFKVKRLKTFLAQKTV
jgi:hypothetical protein